MSLQEIVQQNMAEFWSGLTAGVSMGFLTQGTSDAHKVLGKTPLQRLGYVSACVVGADVLIALTSRNYVQGVAMQMQGTPGCIVGVFVGIPLGRVLGKLWPQEEKKENL